MPGNPKLWSKEEEAFLLQHYLHKGADWCSQALMAMGFERNRTMTGQKARAMGLQYLGPKLGCRKKGEIPTNKGKKVSADTYAKAAPTMFKKGHLPANTVPIGTETFRTDEYWWIKVAHKKWVLKHRLLWEQRNGPIPEGYLVIFKDGNPHNFNPANFELITRKELVFRNRHGRGPSEYSLMSGRAASARLNHRGITDRMINQNPGLLEMSKAETLLNIKQRRKS
ncbi:MAG: HNH endonuclease [Saprospiraceae bacterium]|nr:HNH endonuclease [Saprospiraceae bacterium]